jgi:hypothetical protein
LLSPQSIILLCEELDENTIFNHVIPKEISNEYDDIIFEYSASRERPALSIIVDHKSSEKVEEGIIYIPLHPLGDKKKNMTYITPFLEDLKKYL